MESRLDDVRTQTPSEYRAPSFSWASIDGRVFPGQPSEDGVLTKVEDIKLGVGHGITGAVAGGYVKPRGKLKEIQLSRRFWGDRDQWVMAVNGLKLAPWKSKKWQGKYNLSLDWMFDTTISLESSDRKSLYCLPARKNPPAEVTGILYMLLLEAIDKGLSSFRRLRIAGSCVLATK